MKKYFGKKDSVIPQKNTLLESSLPNSVTNIDNSTQVATTIINDEEELTTDMPKRKKKKTFNEVLLDELKEDRKSRDEFQKK